VNNSSPSIKHAFHQLATLLVLLVLPFFFYLRAKLVDSVIGTGFGLDGAYNKAVLNADAPLFALMGLLVLGSWFIKSYTASVVLRLVVLGLLMFYIADMIVFEKFGIRIFLASVQLYGANTVPVWEQLQEFLGGRWIALVKLLLLGVFAIALLLPPKKPWMISILFCSALTLSATVIAVMPWKVNYVNSWLVQNYISANIFVPEARVYSKAYVQTVRSTQARQCQAGLSRRPNVIILIVESLASYQSQAFGGVHDWTPGLDAIASEAIIYRNMHANGFATNEGLIGILGGVRLFSPFNHMFRVVVPFQTAWGLEQTVPGVFDDAGYHTAFLTNGPLGFSKKGEWMRDIGFQEIEGNEHPFYRNWPKVQFQGAADEALYARSLDWITARPPAQSWMLTMLTISTHQPFLDPETLKPNLEKVFRYADAEAASFIRALQKSEFFENGILLVMGDHRSMTPVSKEEEEIYGPAALSRIQFFMLDRASGGEHNGVFQQSDLLPSFRYLLNETYCHDGQMANVFVPDSPGRCAFHVRGSRPSLVDVFCPGAYGLVELDGDSTRFIENEGISTRKQSDILKMIARERLAGQKRHHQYLENLQSNRTEKQ